MSVRRRSRATSERGLLMRAACGLLEFDRFRWRLGALPTPQMRERRAAVERALTPSELAVVDQIVSGDLYAAEHQALVDQLGPRPDDEDLIAMQEQILGHSLRRGG